MSACEPAGDAEADAEAAERYHRFSNLFFLEPALRRLDSGDPGWVRFTQVMGRVLGETGEHVHAIHQVFMEIRMRFIPAFQRAVPHLSEADLAWRMQFLIGSMCHLLSDPGRLALMTQGRCDARNWEETLEQLVAFVHGGFGAPVAKPASTESPA